MDLVHDRDGAVGTIRDVIVPPQDAGQAIQCPPGSRPPCLRRNVVVRACFNLQLCGTFRGVHRTPSASLSNLIVGSPPPRASGASVKRRSMGESKRSERRTDMRLGEEITTAVCLPVDVGMVTTSVQSAAVTRSHGLPC